MGAGLVDAGETPEQAALRELREETGYTGATHPSMDLAPRASYGYVDDAGTVVGVSPTACYEPGLTSSTCAVVQILVRCNQPRPFMLLLHTHIYSIYSYMHPSIQIDGNLESNKNPRPGTLNRYNCVRSWTCLSI